MIALTSLSLSDPSQRYAGMTIVSSGPGTGMESSLPEVWEHGGIGKKFGKGKGMKKNFNGK